MSSLAYAVSDTLVLAKRNLMRIPRQPDLLIAYTIQPIDVHRCCSSTCSAARSARPATTTSTS